MPNSMLEDVTGALQAALTHLNQGRTSDAVALSDAVLQQAGDHADALHISGLGRVRMGLAQEALPLLQSAHKLRKTDGSIANSLAQAYLSLGDVDSASAALEPLARKNKLPAAGLNTLGNCRLGQRKFAKARACFEKAIKLQPNLMAAKVNIGETLRQSGDAEGAIKYYRKLLDAEPHAQSAWRNLGLALQDAEQFSESITPLQTYLKTAPNDVASVLSVGVGFFKSGRPENALSVFNHALTLAPKNTEALNSRGLALRAIGRTEEAEQDFRNALVIDPTFNTARLNLANLLHKSQGAEAAVAVMNEAVAQMPDDAKAHIERGHIFLQEGRIAEGWDDYAWRFHLPPDFAGKREFPFPSWNGEDLKNQTLLIWGEQGIGDEILYGSLIGEAVAQAKHVVVECDQRLAPLFSRSFPSVNVFERAIRPNRQLLRQTIDYQIAMGDLCRFLRPDIQAFTGSGAYLTVDPQRKATYRERYLSHAPDQLIVGIAWHSGRSKDGWLKTIPLEQWTPILSRPNVTFVSLQYGQHLDEIETARSETNSDLVLDPDVDPLKDMDTFAAQVAAMDLVITNSNAAAHVAGAVSIPVWTMIPHLGSGGLLWYWFKEGKKSLWYDSMTLYRQTQWQQWTDVIDNVACDLKKLQETL